MAKMPRMRNVPIGNFGHTKVKARSTLKEIGMTDAEVVNITPVGEYNRRLIQAYHKTDNPKLRAFIIESLKDHHRKVGTFEKRL